MKIGFAVLFVGLAFGIGAMVFVLNRETNPQVAAQRRAVDAAGNYIDPGRSDRDKAAVKIDPKLPPAGNGAVIAAMAAMPGNRVRLGELDTGAIRTLDGPSVGQVDVSTGDQRGLLGLAVDENGVTYVAYTEQGGARRIVVEKVGVGATRRVWTGPPSAKLANGGHIALSPDGRLVIGIGDLGQRDRLNDPRYPNGKMLSLSLDGPPNQTPKILSSGWNNPYAFAFTPDGTLWVADNAPGRQPERLGRGDGTGPRTPLGHRTAPSGLVALDDHTLAVCGVVSQRLDRYKIDASGRTHFDGTISDGCTFGVVKRGDGSLLVSTASGLVPVRP